jgi:hypothetical protein
MTPQNPNPKIKASCLSDLISNMKLQNGNKKPGHSDLISDMKLQNGNKKPGQETAQIKGSSNG